MRRALLVPFVALAFGSPPALAQSSPETVARLKAAAAGDHRPERDKARDRYRNPVETLAFFGIRDDMTVVEIWPGGGWYTRILAPFLKDKGRLYLAAYEPGVVIRNATNAQREEVAARPEVFGQPVFTVLEKGKYDIAPPGSADLVLTFRNLHNWMDAGDAEEVMKAMYRALKPGGVLGFVEHRANPGPQDPRAKNGYVTEDYAIKLVEGAGFRLVGRSEINANPQDTKNHPRGVWTLPPSFALKDTDREKYAAIGESDRMTLKFVKPAN
jgi:predicted methyltransferase